MSAAVITPAQHCDEYSTSMHLGDYDFRWRWLPTLVMAAAVGLFVALGLWQLDRADEKRQQAEELAARSLLPPYPLMALESSPEPLRHRRLTATGVFETEGQILLENRRQGGKTGFHVITPLRIDGGDVRVLVNRGWIPADAQGHPAPARVPEGPRTLTGEAHIPAPPAMALHGGAGAAAAWGDRWPYLTTDLYQAWVDHPIQPLVILMDPGEPDGFQRTWPREMPKEGMHIGYAVQWFAFAVIALAIWLRLSLERRSPPGVDP
jgi:surfeit locus 1 family protein